MNGPAAHQSIIEDYLNGVLVEEIADRHGCSSWTVHRTVRAHQIPPRGPRQGHGPRFPMQPLERLLGRPTAREISDQVGAKWATVRQWRHRGLSFWQADEIATGLRADEVWPEWGADDLA